MSKVAVFTAFVIGAAAGAGCIYYILKKQYEDRLQEEIDSVKAVYSRKYNREEPKTASEAIKPSEKPAINTYAAFVRDQGYTRYSTDISNRKEEKPGNGPHPISPDEFGEIEDYEKISLVYYSGGETGVLADDNDEAVNDPEGLLGEDYLDHFGDYEDDICYIRDDELKADYEIVRDLRAYEEILNDKPWLRAQPG